MVKPFLKKYKFDPSQATFIACDLNLLSRYSTTLYSDNYNHRVVQWKSSTTSGVVVAGGNGKGNRTDQLNNPTDIIINRERNYLIICDQGNRRIIR